MTDDVTIPAGVAKRIALVVRQARDVGLLKLGDDVDHWTDLLEPRKATLREKVIRALSDVDGNNADRADAVLAVFRAALTDLKRPATVTTLDAAIEYVDEALFGGGSS